VVTAGELGEGVDILLPPLSVPVDLFTANRSKFNGLRAPLRGPGGLGIAKLSLDLSYLVLPLSGVVFSGVLPLGPLSPGVFKGFSSFLEVRRELDKFGEEVLDTLTLESLILSELTPLLVPVELVLFNAECNLFINMPESVEDPASTWSSNTISGSESLTPFKPAAPPLLDRLTSLS
jgi:hypothetical protein